jgi:phosphoglycolate phosphatase-like HAD superfamily hydrolase
VVFLGPRANAELVPEFHVALHASHAALPMLALTISPYTNVTLAFDFNFGLDHPVQRDMGEGTLREEEIK